MSGEENGEKGGDFRTKYGKGFEIIKRMGFKGGGLGVDGTGISEPIHVKSRQQSNIGIGRQEEEKKRGFEGKKDLNAEKYQCFEQDVKGDQPHGNGMDSDEKKRKLGFEGEGDVMNESGIRRGHLDDILELVLSFKDDLGFRREELQTNIKEKEAEIEERTNEIDNLVRKKRVLEDLHKVTTRMQTCFLNFDQKIQQMFDDQELSSLFECEKTKDQSTEENRTGKVKEAVDEFIYDVKEAFSECDSESSVDASKSYLLYSKIITDVLKNALNRIYLRSCWNVRKNPEYGKDMWMSIKELFVLFENGRCEREYDSRHFYEHLVTKFVGKALENYYLYCWNPVEENDFGLFLLGIWENIVPEEYIKDRLLEQIIWKRQAQKLQLDNSQARMSSKEEFNGKMNIQTMTQNNEDETSRQGLLEHKWLFLWLPYYYKYKTGYFIAKLLSKQIDKALSVWDPPEIWPIALLSMWRPVLESNTILLENDEYQEMNDRGEVSGEEYRKFDNEFSYLILSRVYSKLSSYLEDNFVILEDFRQQDLLCIDHLEMWFKEDLLDRFLVSQLFVEVIGPKWLSCLCEKLSRVRNEYLGEDQLDFDYLNEYGGGKNTREIDFGLIHSYFIDIHDWYKFWRLEVFSKQVMISSRTKVFLAKALVMIDFHLNHYSGIAWDDKTDGDSTNNVGDGYVDHNNGDSQYSFQIDGSNNLEDSFVLGLLEWVSSETGLMIKPTKRKELVSGKQIYSLEWSKEQNKNTRSKYFKTKNVGSKCKCLFYINEGVVFCFKRNGSDSRSDEGEEGDVSWNPTSIVRFIERFGVEMR